MSPDFAHIADFHALRRAAHQAAQRKRKTPGACAFLAELEPNLLALERALRDRSYHPRPYRSFLIHKPKQRLISAAWFGDRVEHHALCAELEPVFERFAIADSYACRTGKGQQRAVQRLQGFTRRWPFALRLDIRQFFVSVCHDRLSAQVARRVPCAGVRWLADTFIAHAPPGAAPGRGLAIGNLTSQHFANFHLSHLDRFIKQGLRVKGYLRYMDDMVLLGDHKPTLWGWHAAIGAWLAEHLDLALNPNATRVLPVHTGVPFLGFRVFPGLIRLGPTQARRLAHRLRTLRRRVDRGLLAEDDAAQVAHSLLGWARHGNTARLVRAVCAAGAA